MFSYNCFSFIFHDVHFPSSFIFHRPSISMSFIFHLRSLCLPFFFSCNFHTLLGGQSFSFSVIFHPCFFVVHFPFPSFSTPAFLSIIFHSCIFFSCFFSVPFQIRVNLEDLHAFY